MEGAALQKTFKKYCIVNRHEVMRNTAHVGQLGSMLYFFYRFGIEMHPEVVKIRNNVQKRHYVRLFWRISIEALHLFMCQKKSVNLDDSRQ